MNRRRTELTDKAWLIFWRFLPDKPRRVPKVDDQRVLNSTLWRFCSGET